MPNESKKKTEKSNVVPMKKRPAKRERLTTLDGLVLAMVRVHRPPTDALDFLEREPADGAVEASLAKLERLGHIRPATGYVATGPGPEVGAYIDETDEKRRKVYRPELLANEFCVTVDAVVGILRRIGIEPDRNYRLIVEKAG
jgi:hypothetical protein